jgi:hypothetical protein
LEYGVRWHLEKFVNQLKQGVPAATDKANAYVEELSKARDLIVQWLEDFKAKYGAYQVFVLVKLVSHFVAITRYYSGNRRSYGLVS